MNEMAKKILKFKTNTNIQIGLDIGGTLTKMAIYLSKSIPCNRKAFQQDFECNDHIELDHDHLFIKQFHTNKFNPEAIDFLTSKNRFLGLNLLVSSFIYNLNTNITKFFFIQVFLYLIIKFFL